MRQSLLIFDDMDWIRSAGFDSTVSICHEQIDGLPRQTNNTSNNVSIPYHWEDEDKRSSDYQTIAESYEFVLSRISSILGALHGTSTTHTYWETAIGAWLGTAMSIVKDRMEFLDGMVRASPSRAAVFEHSISSFRPSKDTQEFVKLASSSDSWNRQFLVHLCREYFEDEVSIIKEKCDSVETSGFINGIEFSANLPLDRILASTRLFLDSSSSLVSRVLSTGRPRNSIAIDSSYMSLLSLTEIKLRLRNTADVVRVRRPSKGPLSANNRARRHFLEYLSDQPSTNNYFADLFLQETPHILPESFLENFDSLRSQMISLNSTPKLVFTANSHWYDDFFKIWAAEMREHGSKLVFAEHGGSFQAAQHIFNFQQRSSDVFVSRWPPKHEGEISLPLRLEPRKRERKLSKSSRNLVLITYPGDKWAIRASSQPQSYRAVSIAQDLSTLVGALKLVPKDRVIVQLKKTWSSWKLLESRYTSGNLSNCRIARDTLPKVLKQARLIVCTYPETTFTDSVLEGIPTILLFNPKVSRVTHDAMNVIRGLQKQNIVFFSDVEAARFIDSVWRDPFTWWNSPDTQLALGEFIRFSGLDQKSPVESWSRFFADLVNG